MAVAVFWWSGRGYLTVLVTLGVLAGFGIAAAVGRQWLSDGPAFWGGALLASAVVNWIVGTRINRKKLAVVRRSSLRRRLLYRTGHRFMSMPMETFSIPLAALGLAVALSGFGV